MRTSTPNADTVPRDALSPCLGVSPSTSHAIPEREWGDYRELGIRALRIHLQAGRDWADYDRVLRRCRDEGIEVMMLASYESYAAVSEEEEPPWGGTRRRYTNASALLDVLAKAVPRFREQGARAWEIWNEQNGTWHVPPDEYAELLCRVYERCKLGNNPWDRGTTIVFGGLDAVGWFHPRGGNDHARRYLADVYASAAFEDFRARTGRAPFDAMAIHPYGTETRAKFDYSLETVCLETMRAHDDGDLPIWITELGDFNEDDDENARKLEHFVRCAAAHPSVARLHWFKYTYPGIDGHALYSLVMESGRRRSAFERYRDLVRELSRPGEPGRSDGAGACP